MLLKACSLTPQERAKAVVANTESVVTDTSYGHESRGNGHEIGP